MTIDKDRLIGLVDKMPTFPASAHRIIELSANVNCAPRDLVEVIDHDPILTLKVLKLVNSAYYGLAKEVTSVKHAVVYLGINTVKNLALSVATIGSLPADNELGFDMSKFWWHSLVTGSIARELAKRSTGDETVLSKCYVGGLLHDVGKVVFVQFLADQYKESLDLAAAKGIPSYLAEQEIIGLHHAQAGALVGEKWQLPEELVTCIGDHHDLATKAEPSVLDSALYVGNQLSKIVKIEEGEEPPVLEEAPGVILDWLGNSIEDELESLSNLPDIMERAQVFIDMSAE